MQLIDRELACQLEEFDAWANAECVRALGLLRPALGVQVQRIGGGYACYAGHDSPFTRAGGVGMAGSVTHDEFDQIEAIPFQRGCASVLEVSPFVDSSVLKQLGLRVYQPSEMVNILFRELDDRPVGLPGAGITVERVGPKTNVEWVNVISEGFMGTSDIPEPLRDIARAIAHCESAKTYLARVDGRPAGGGALFRSKELAGLSGSAVLPGFRNRGVHGALLAARLADARNSGCQLAVMGATPDGGSHRNVERLGFRVAYTRVAYRRAFAKQD